MRTHILEQELPQLSIADLEAVGTAIARRWQELKASELRMVLETHYTHLRALPAGTLVEYVGADSAPFTHGEFVPLVRPLRPPSPNMSVQDRHGKPWKVPMEYFVSATENASVRAALGSVRRDAAWRHLAEGLFQAQAG